MFTITKCPFCENNFMFHKSDYHLMKNDAFGTFVICQKCYIKEQKKIYNKRKKNDKL